MFVPLNKLNLELHKIDSTKNKFSVKNCKVFFIFIVTNVGNK